MCVLKLHVHTYVYNVLNISVYTSHNPASREEGKLDRCEELKKERDKLAEQLSIERQKVLKFLFPY